MWRHTVKEQTLVTAKPPPPLNIPESKKTVKVSVIDPKCRVKLPHGPLIQPEYAGNPDLQGPCLIFLIEHASSKPVLFDLGIRKDWEKLPSYQRFVNLNWYINVEKDVASVLKENGVDVDGGAIDSIIWSHHHWDHVGNPATFPSSTGLVIGPGFKEAHLPGYPKNPDSTLLETDYEGRDVREISFEKEGRGLKIGRFNAFDYFGDGSFYLLDTPGHTIGHICGLARTSSDPDSFIFMGGDAAHHGGEFRPTEYLPIPTELNPSPLKSRAGVCPGHLLQEIHCHGKGDKPFYYLTEKFPYNKPTAEWTIDGLGEFDAHDNILSLMAHDNTVVDPPKFDLYPKPINDWYKKDVAKKVRWLFLGDFDGAVEAKANGKPPFSWTQE